MPTVSEIQKALVRCLAIEKPENYRLSKDSADLAAVYAEVLYDGEENRPLETFTPKQRDAYERWFNEAGTPKA